MLPKVSSPSTLHSFRYAWWGIQTVFATQRNFRTHLVIGSLVIAAGLLFQVTRTEWCLLLLCIGAMLTTEVLNTAIEFLVDALTLGQKEEAAKIVKDSAAAACLITAVFCTLVGVLVFWPYILQ
ncbi:MAG: diacylglycerol kinase family protein [Candidatus Melainabacteria bacterium]